MSAKRPRAAYEADLQAQQSPFVLFGTPLPPLDPEVRDDGSYVPLWKQEVRDERGRKRLHGAFTGGWSAGYFNTVGSKEGWTPSTFVSSRTNRHKDGGKPAQQRPEDYMDDEDLADADDARKIETSEAFAGLGLTNDDVTRTGGLAGLFRVDGATMGTKLLRKMGWKEGQGIGPKIRRTARLDVIGRGGAQTTHLFAPDDVNVVSFIRKLDRKGLGFEGEARLAPIGVSPRDGPASQSDDDIEDDIKRPAASLSFVAKKKKERKIRGGMGVGILNDTGSDDEDPYEIGPRISYNRVIGGDKKKLKKKDKDKGAKETLASTSANPLLKSKPVFISKKAVLGRIDSNLRRGHDGRLPLDGFVFGLKPDPFTSEVTSKDQYAPPKIPEGWKSAKKLAQQNTDAAESTFMSTAEAAKSSRLDPRSRAAVLGEKQLPGKSVFDFMSTAARDRLSAATGRTDLPEARGEIPEGYALSEAEKLQQVLEEVPKLEKETALAAIVRGTSGGAAYGDNPAKRARYLAYLESQAGSGKGFPAKPAKMSNDDWLREFHEFYNCARIFKPMSGFMASRFTTSSSSKHATGSSGKTDEQDLVTKPPPKPSDPAEEAAKMGMFGNLTRSVQDFYPTRLLCKRLNVKPPAHVQAEQEVDNAASKATSTRYESYGSHGAVRDKILSLEYTAPGPTEGAARQNDAPEVKLGLGPSDTEQARIGAIPSAKPPATIEPGKNEALEGKRAGEDVFRAVFGDSSDEDD